MTNIKYSAGFVSYACMGLTLIFYMILRTPSVEFITLAAMIFLGFTSMIYLFLEHEYTKKTKKRRE